VIRSHVMGCGSFLPRTILTNAELAKRVDTSDEWIRERTGIQQRSRDLDVSPSGRHMKRCRPRYTVARVNVRAGSHQRTDDVRARFRRAFVRDTIERHMVAATLDIWVHTKPQ